MKVEDELDEEIELYRNSRERQAYDDQATLYAIILATEHLERAYARDAITQQEYTTECNKLISQFRLAEKAAFTTTTTTTKTKDKNNNININSTTEAFMKR